MLNLVLIFLALGFGLLQALIGGARLVYALPAYAVLAIAGFLAFGARPATERQGPRIVCVLAATLIPDLPRGIRRRGSTRAEARPSVQVRR